MSFEGQEYSYSLLHTEARRLAEILMDTGIRPDDHVGIYLSNSPYFIMAFFAIQMIGAVAIMIPAVFKQWELSNEIRLCDVEYIITDDRKLSVLKDCNLLKAVPYSDSKNINVAILNNEIKPMSRTEKYGSGNDRPSVILLTSGVTAHHKAVMLSGKNILQNALVTARQLAFDANDSSLLVLPLTASFALYTQMFVPLMRGGKIVFNDKIFIPQTIIKILTDKKPTMTCLVPSLYLQILNHIDKPCTTSLRLVVLAGTPIPGNVLDLSTAKLPTTQITTMYGLTEAGLRTVLHSQDHNLHKDTVGKAVAGMKIKVVDEDGRTRRANDPGEIWAKGKGVMIGYYKNAELSDRTITQGWLHTGDIGKISPDGYLSIIGRMKNIIIRDGLKVIPEEIEEFLCTYPGIKEAMIYAEKKNNVGEKIIAKIVPDSQCIVSIDAVMVLCRNNLASYKIPDEIVFVNNIDKTPNGKIKRT
jgi:long-chain acyl-CoA synthetase